MIGHVPAPLLAGALSGFDLADVLQLLELGARTGVLVVNGGPLGGGSVRLRDGRVVAVSIGRGEMPAAGDYAAAVATLLDLSAGQWAFHLTDDAAATDASNGPSEPGGVRIAAILVDAARRRDERMRVAADATHPDADVPQLAWAEEQGDEPDTCGRLTAADLHVLAAVDGVRDVRAIAAAVRRDVARVRDAIGTLRAFGVVRARETRACGGDTA